jgi:hypothetical protein
MTMIKKTLILSSLVLMVSLVSMPVSWAQLNNPWTLCMADFNGDGLNDLVAANNAGGMIGVFINKGDGTFANTNYPGGNQGRHCAVADLNGDGAPDVVITSNDAQRGVSVMLNNGDGTFSITYYTAGQGTWSVAIDDLNSDGFPDIVTSNSGGGGTIGVLLNDGAGQFTPAEGSPFPSGRDSRFVALFDTNKDGILDAVVANYGVGELSVLLGKGDGTFDYADRTDFLAEAGEPSLTADHPNRMAIGDFDKDGVLDLIYANHGARSGDTVFRHGNGDGTFGDPVISPTRVRPESMVGPVDFDGDGNLDVVTGSDVNGFLVKLGDGDGNFTRTTRVLTGARVRALAVGDIDGDGIPDLVVANQILNSELMLFLGDGKGGFIEP